MSIILILIVVTWGTLVTIYTLLTGDYGVKWQHIGIFYEVCAIFVLWLAGGSPEEDELYGGDDD